MSKHSLSYLELVKHPKVSQFLDSDSIVKIAGQLIEIDQVVKDPIYIRILSGIGAWVAALFLIFFLGIVNIFDSHIGALICGIVFLVAAIIISRASKATFLTQLSLALAFAGNIAVLYGASDIFGRDFTNLNILITQAVVCLVVYPLYDNNIYRFLMPISVAVLATSWIIDSKLFVLMHVLIVGETIFAGIFLLSDKRFYRFRPLVYASATMLPATLLFMNLLQTSTWITKFSEPLWPSSILLSICLIYVYFYLTEGNVQFNEPWLTLAIGATVLLGIFTTPGILVAMGLLVLGYAFGDRILMALAFVFLASFLIVFYYALTIDLAYKSFVVASSGVLLLMVRFIAGYYAPKEVSS